MHKTIAAIALTLVFLPGCSKAESPPASKKEKTEATQGEKAEATTPEGDEKAQPADKGLAVLEGLFPATVSLPPEFAEHGLRLGIKAEDVRPLEGKGWNVSENEMGGTFTGNRVFEPYKDSGFRVDFGYNGSNLAGVGQLYLLLAGVKYETVLATLEKKYGPAPITWQGKRKPFHVWPSPDGKLSLSLSGARGMSTANFATFMSLEATIQPGEAAAWGFEGEVPLLGSTEDEVKAAYPQLTMHMGTLPVLPLAYTEYTTEQPLVSLNYDAEKRVNYVFIDLKLDPAAEESVTALLKKKLGEGTPVDDNLVWQRGESNFVTLKKVLGKISGIEVSTKPPYGFRTP